MVKVSVLSTLLLYILFQMPITQAGNEVEIFDINQGDIVQTTPAYLKVQDEVISYLDHISAVYPKVNPIPHDGMMIKIPLDPAHLVENEWLSSLVDEVIIILPKNEDPFLLVFDDENSAHFFYFKGDMFSLLEQINMVKKGISLER